MRNQWTGQIFILATVLLLTFCPIAYTRAHANDATGHEAAQKGVMKTSPAERAVPEVAEQSFTVKHMYIGECIVVGADGHYITLRNNPVAVNPSWAELKAFLHNDRTDSRYYDKKSFVCADFAETIHNNAEAQGIRAAFVEVRINAGADSLTGGEHALNAFETTDRGLVFVDCVSANQGMNADRIVQVGAGKEYIPRSIFPASSWEAVLENTGIVGWESAGIVEEVKAIEW